MTADHPTPATAQAALAAAHTARAAARAARRVPAWHPPVAGLLYAAGFTGLALGMEHPNAFVTAASLGALLGFFTLFVANARAGGVLLRPTGTPRERWRRQSPVLFSIAAAVAAAFLIGASSALVVFGVTQGAVTWFQMHRARTRRTA